MFNGVFKTIKESHKRLESHVSVEAVKFNLNIPAEDKDEDEFIGDLIEAAIDDAQDYTDHHFGLSEYEYRLYNFVGNKIRFDVSPFDSIVTFEYSDDNENWTVINATEYAVDKNDSRFIIEFDESKTYDYIRLVFRVGYRADALPKNAERAIILKASDMYDVERSSWTIKAQNQRTYENALSKFYHRRW